MSQHAFDSFRRHLQARGLRPRTQDRYVEYVSRFVTFAKTPALEVSASQAYDFLVDFANRKKISSSWYNGHYWAVVRWFEMRDVPLNLRGLEPQRRHLQAPRWLSEDEVLRMNDAIADRRYRLIFQVIVATGLRVSEVLAMRVADIDPKAHLLRVPCGKGGNGRLVYLPPELRERLRSYYRVFQPRGLFFTRSLHQKDVPICAATLNEALNRARIMAGIEQKVTAHCLRHTFAIHSLRRGVDIVTLKEALGHRKIDSTIRYLTPDLRRDMAQQLDLLTELGVKP
jgi:integrase